MKKKRHVNIFRIIWVSGIFLLLITILLMVMDYKINYEYLTRNYLYFYDCDGSVCTVFVDDSISKDSLYSTYNCGYDTCPSIKRVIDDYYVILSKDDSNILYNYIDGYVVSDIYDDYYALFDSYFIVTQNDYQGLIDSDNNILISASYQQLGYYKDSILVGYNLQKIIVKKNDLYGIVSIKDGSLVEDIIYEEDSIEDLIDMLDS